MEGVCSRSCSKLVESLEEKRGGRKGDEGELSRTGASPGAALRAPHLELHGQREVGHPARASLSSRVGDLPVATV